MVGGQRAHQRFDRALGHRDGSVVTHTNAGGHRREHQQPPCPASSLLLRLLQRADVGLGGEKGGVEVGGEAIAVLRLAGAGDAGQQDGTSGVHHRARRRAEGGRGLGDRPQGTRFCRDLGFDQHIAVIGRELVQAAAGADHAPALCAQRGGERAGDAAGAAGDQAGGHRGIRGHAGSPVG